MFPLSEYIEFFEKRSSFKRLYKSTLSLPVRRFRRKVMCSVTSLSYQTISIEFYHLDNYHSFLITFITFEWFFGIFSAVSYLDMLFPTKTKVKDLTWAWNEKYSQKNRLFLSLIWWISPKNVMILTWKLCHSFSIILPTYSPNFSSLEFSWAEIEFWRGCLKCFSIFLSSWFFDHLPNFPRSNLIQYI